MINQLHPDLEVRKCDLKGSWTRLSLFYFFKPAILLNILNCISWYWGGCNLGQVSSVCFLNF